MKRISWVALGWFCLSTTLHAASFDCGKSQSKIEKFICGSNQLSKLDENLDKIYKGVQDNFTLDEKQQLVSEQRQWIKNFRNKCSDEHCLVQAYSSRIETIQSIHPSNVSEPFIKTDVLLNKNIPIGKGYPTIGRSIDRDLVYSHYDDNGNTKSIVRLDFTTGQWLNLVEGKRDPQLIAQDSRYIIFHTPHSASFPIEVVNRKTGASLAKIRLSRPVENAFIDGNRLVLFQGFTNQIVVAILQLPSLKLIEETSIPGFYLISIQGNRIYTAGNSELFVFDNHFNKLGYVPIPQPIEKLNLNCHSSLAQNENDRAVLLANCGEIHVINLKNFSIKHTIPRYANFYSVALYKGLIFTTTEKQSGIVVFDMDTARELARLPITATYIFIKGDTLLAADAPINGRSASWPMATYRINADAIRSGVWKNQAIIAACSQARQLVQESGDIYEAVRLCGQSGVGSVLDSPNISEDILPHVLNYATWLSQTLHRYGESLIIFDKLRSLGIPVNSEAVNEATDKKLVFDSPNDLEALRTVSNGSFAKALKLGLSQEPIKTIDLPKLAGNLYFMDGNIFAPRWDCYPVAGDGVGIEVYSRRTFDHLTWLKVRDCDDEQQDSIEAISADQNKLYVRTGFRYPDEARTNYFVFDKTTWNVVAQKVFLSGTDAFPQIDTEKRYPTQYSDQENDITTKSYRVHREYITSSTPGSTQYIFNKNNLATNSNDNNSSFVMQGTSSSTPIAIPNKDEVIFVGNPDDIGRLSLIRFDPVTSKGVTFAVLPTVAAWAIDDKNFYVSNGVDILIFNLANFTLTKVIPSIFQAAAPAAKYFNNDAKINNIYLDQGRMIVRTLNGTSSVFDISN